MPPEKLVQGLDKIILCDEEEFELGTGSFGTAVYVGLLDDGREVAVKQVLQKGPRGKKSVQDEVDIYVKLRSHDNIVSYMTVSVGCLVVLAVLPPPPLLSGSSIRRRNNVKLRRRYDGG
ncbi:hypothetical protein LSAT2_008964 [Lamellibrachia satsuma]|nr:hypothetical protein LSAT2_008964 [Lamellibrachia satsuma]